MISFFPFRQSLREPDVVGKLVWWVILFYYIHVPNIFLFLGSCWWNFYSMGGHENLSRLKSPSVQSGDGLGYCWYTSITWSYLFFSVYIYFLRTNFTNQSLLLFRFDIFVPFCCSVVTTVTAASSLSTFTQECSTDLSNCVELTLHTIVVLAAVNKNFYRRISTTEYWLAISPNSLLNPPPCKECDAMLWERSWTFTAGMW